MELIMKKTLIQGVMALSCALGLAVDAELAAAATVTYPAGYVCTVRYSRQPNATYGDTGYLQVTVRTAGLCGGSSIGTFYVKSPGGSANGYSFSEVERTGLMAELMQASRQATQVTVRADDVGFGVYDFTFRAE
jgi:hypothetical protein